MINNNDISKCEQLLWELENGIPNKPYQKVNHLRAMIEYVKSEMSKNDKK